MCIRIPIRTISVWQRTDPSPRLREAQHSWCGQSSPTCSSSSSKSPCRLIMFSPGLKVCTRELRALEYQESTFRKWSITADVFFVVTAILYFLTSCTSPGYVNPAFDIIVSLPILISKELLRHANEKSIDLENFCFYCRVIKSGRTFHCTFCNR